MPTINPADIDATWPDGVLVTSTFDAWRKKTNGFIDAYNTGSLVPDGSITPVKLSTGGPAWTSEGVLTVADQLKAKSLAVGSTYGQFTVSEAGVVVAFNTITGTSLNTAGAVSANSLAIGTSNNKFTVGSTGTVVATGSITGTSLNAGSGLITTTGAVNANSLAIATNKFTVSDIGAVIAADEAKSKSLAIGTNNTQFTVSAAGTVVATGSITGTSLSAGSGSITGASLNIGTGAIIAGAITATGNAIAATPTLSTHLTTKAYVDTTITSEIAANLFVPFAKAYCTIASNALTVRQNSGFSSIVRNSAGRYTCTLSTAQANTHYKVLIAKEIANPSEGDITVEFATKTTNTFIIENTNDNSSIADPLAFSVVVFS